MVCIVSVPVVRIQERNMVFWIDCLKDMAVGDLINPQTNGEKASINNSLICEYYNDLLT
jgi:hypothetical protein